MKLRIRFGAAIAALAIMAGGAWADVDRGLAAKAQENFPAALREFRKSADAGDARGMFNLAKMYLYGEGVPKDREVYADWIRRAAEDGFAEAENSMGWIYTHWRDRPVVGFQWYLRAAAQGNVDSLSNVAYGYEHGFGVDANGAKAIEFYTRAVDAGLPTAGYQIGVMHYSGEVVPKDFAKAAEYFKRGAAQEHAKSEFFLSHLYYHGEGVETDFDAYEDYRRRSARHGYIRAQLELGEYYAGFFSKSFQTGAQWYEMAAKQGSLKGMVGLLQAYRRAGEAGEPELKTELTYEHWLEQAAEYGDGEAAWEMAALVFAGTGFDKDEARADELVTVTVTVTVAVKDNYPDAMRWKGVKRMQDAKSRDEFLLGFELIYGAAAQRNTGAMLTLAQIFREGNAVDKDIRVAYLWALEARRNGYGTGSDQVEAYLAQFTPEIDPTVAYETRNYFDNCRSFYACVLDESEFTDELKNTLRKYTPDYYE